MIAQDVQERLAAAKAAQDAALRRPAATRTAPASKVVQNSRPLPGESWAGHQHRMGYEAAQAARPSRVEVKPRNAGVISSAFRIAANPQNRAVSHPPAHKPTMNVETGLFRIASETPSASAQQPMARRPLCRRRSYCSIPGLQELRFLFFASAQA